MPFEDELGEALRRVGDSFDTDRQEKLIMTATERGRHSVRRRRTWAVAASVIALGVLGTGAYASGILPDLDREASVADETPVVGGERVLATFEKLLPDGTISRRKDFPRKPGEYVHVSFVYDDGRSGAGLVDFRMGVADPRRGDTGRDTSRSGRTGKAGAAEVWHDRNQEVTPDGHFIEVTVWNAPDPKSPRGSRPEPVLWGDVTRLMRAGEWRKELDRLPKPDPLLGEKPMDPAWVRPPVTVTGPGMAATLTSLLPKGTITAPDGRDTSHPLGPAGSVLYDDGEGGARVEVALYRVDPDGPSTQQFTRCYPRACKRQELPGGSAVDAYEARPGKGLVERKATYVSAGGDMVEVTAWNAPGEKRRPVRDEPPLTLEQLKSVAMSPAWKKALGALPAAPEEETGGPTRPTAPYRYMDELGIEGKRIEDEDGLGPGLIELRRDESRRNTTSEPQLAVRQEPVEGGGKGVVRWVVTGARPGGVYVTVTAYNAPAPDADATRTTPAVGLPLLKATVLSGLWNDETYLRSLEARR
ncbi:hypothetical protein [Streptomyces roseolilacinus]|uniref:Uncharacterized protein n=1 Tax=Streptomyces roseolilacinus TaxID=66904 RepID=A0A918EL62_9ACTN|nr:hypothetical protein [Streptomyces roseolilacinus]GGQ05330.1 hypothetical protein GCM10010249_24710 [Streptomyces roseolilacinus]